MKVEGRKFSSGMAIDVDTHWCPPEWEEVLVREGGSHGAKIGETSVAR